MRKWVESPEHCQLAVLSKLVMTMMVEERNKYHISALHASLLLPPHQLPPGLLPLGTHSPSESMSTHRGACACSPVPTGVSIHLLQRTLGYEQFPLEPWDTEHC